MKNGFTLADILITMAILGGVLTLLTLLAPTIKAKYTQNNVQDFTQGWDGTKNNYSTGFVNNKAECNELIVRNINNKIEVICK